MTGFNVHPSYTRAPRSWYGGASAPVRPLASLVQCIGFVLRHQTLKLASQGSRSPNFSKCFWHLQLKLISRHKCAHPKSLRCNNKTDYGILFWRGELHTYFQVLQVLRLYAGFRYFLKQGVELTVVSEIELTVAASNIMSCASSRLRRIAIPFLTLNLLKARGPIGVNPFSLTGRTGTNLRFEAVLSSDDGLISASVGIPVK